MIFKLVCRYTINFQLETKGKHSYKNLKLVATPTIYKNKSGIPSITIRLKNPQKNEKIQGKFITKNNIEINYFVKDNNIYFDYSNNYYNYKKVNLNSKELINPDKLFKGISAEMIFDNIVKYYNKQDIEKYGNEILKKEFIHDFFNTLSVSDDNIKLNFINFFLYKDYKRVEEFFYGIRAINPNYYAPMFRDFLRLFLSLDDSNILDKEEYKLAFKTLLFMDWVLLKGGYASFLEHLLFYGSLAFGKNNVSKLLNIDKSIFNKINFNAERNIIPMIKINKNSLEKTLLILKDIYEETQNDMSEKLKNNMLNNLYRGILVKIDKIDNAKINSLKDIIDYYKNKEDKKKVKENIVNSILDTIKNYKNKPFESWSDKGYISENFMRKNVGKNFSLNDIDKFTKNLYDEDKSYEKFQNIEPFAGINLVIDFSTDKSISKNIFFTYHIFNKNLDKLLKITKNKSILNTHALELINKENEYILIDTSKILNKNNLSEILFRY